MPIPAVLEEVASSEQGNTIINEIMDCIDRITVSEGRQIKVTWADTD